MKPANSILSSYGMTVFEVMSRLAIEHEAVNLGQGFPDEDGPEDIRRVAAEALMAGPNQYPPMMGVIELRQAVAEHNKRFYDLDVDWQTETMVTSGATEGLNDCFMGLIEPGDEVVLIEPLYDCYLPIVQRGRRDSETGPCGAAGLGPAAPGAGRGVFGPHQADPAQFAAEFPPARSIPGTSWNLSPP